MLDEQWQSARRILAVRLDNLGDVLVTTPALHAIKASLPQARLTLLASPTFTAAFGGSTNQNDYRWGKLHRITFSHILGSPFSIPPAGGAFPQPLAGLSGIPADGGYQTVDAASFGVKANSVNAFTFSSGPSQRFVGEGRHEGMRGVSSLPGGISGVLGSPFYVNLLPQWLTNHAYDQLFTEDELKQNIMNVTKFVP